ncbi:uncharacterized protein LOC134840700 isoform X2 [Symsagittifera roscoffensis]|uniref:uncharacterized protein LOC134840700 isoform X2 n=1 Tax=Symsagittifera roscoffensis TaxID=84072 RepID=UPI00307C1BD7
MPLANIGADAVTRSPTPLLQSVKATLQPVLSAVCEGLPRNRAFAAALPKLEKLRKTQEAICALHFRCDRGEGRAGGPEEGKEGFNASEFETMSKALHSLHLSVKEIHDQMRHAEENFPDDDDN